MSKTMYFKDTDVFENPLLWKEFKDKYVSTPAFWEELQTQILARYDDYLVDWDYNDPTKLTRVYLSLRTILLPNYKLWEQIYNLLQDNGGYFELTDKQESTDTKVTKVSDTPQSQTTSIDLGYLSSEMKETNSHVTEDKSVMSVISLLRQKNISLWDYILPHFESCFYLIYVI